jgi:hypothetical protein
MDETNKIDASEPSRGKLRFSIGQLLVVTAVVSVVLMVLVTLGPPLWSLARIGPARAAFFDTLLGPLNASGVWQQIVTRIPRFAVWLIGAIVLVRRRKQHEGVSQCALAGLAGLFLLEIVAIGLTVWMTYWMRTQLQPPVLASSTAVQTVVPPTFGPPPYYAEVSSVFYRFVRPMVDACCWVLILLAVLAWRGEELKKDESLQCE